MQFLLDWGSFVALLMLSIAVCIQMLKIIEKQSSGEISLITVTIRTIAMAIILLKMVAIRDWYLICGQTMLMVTYACFAATVLKYRRNIKKA